MDELAEQGEEIEEQLKQAVEAENYSLASEVSAELRELKAHDYVEVASQALQQALEIEDYQRAAALRDRAGLGLLGWWAGKSSNSTTSSSKSTSCTNSSNNDHGHLLYVSKDFGRVVGEAFSAKDLASLVEQKRPLDGPDNGASILMSSTSSIGSLGALEDAFSGFVNQDEQQIEYGRPVFEVFLKPNGSSDEGGGEVVTSLDIQQKVAAIRVHPDTVNQVMPSMVESLAEVITGDLTDNGQKVVSVESGADQDGEYVRINLSSGKSDDNDDEDDHGDDKEDINVESFLEKFYEEEEAAEKKKKGDAEREMHGIHARQYADVANTAEEEGELTSFESMQIQFQRVPADIQWQGRDAFTITVDDTINSTTTDYYHEHDESTSSTTAEAAMLAISNNNNNNDAESSPFGTSTTAPTDEILEKPVQETIEDLKARLVADSDDLTLESLAAEIEAIQAERLKQKEGNNSNDKDKDDKEIFNKVFTKVMKAAMEDEKIMDRDNGMLFFNSVADGNTLAYSRLPPSQATKTDPLSGLFIGAFGPHGPEIVQVTRTNKQNGEEWVVATKLTGDVNVPAGKVSFKAQVGRAARLSISEAYPTELGVVARYKGQGMVAKEGYKHAKWVDGELLQLSKSNPLTKGAELGFVFALDGLRRYLILFAKLDLDEIAEMRENNNN